MKTFDELKKEIDELREKLKTLEVEYYKRTNGVLMTAIFRGKRTFVIYPIEQKKNLMANGWIVCDRNKLDDFLKFYNL